MTDLGWTPGWDTASIRLAPGKAAVQVNGTVLHGVTALRVEGAVDRVPSLVLELPLWEVEVEGGVEVEVPPETRAALVLLGWTPPPGGPATGGTADG